MAIACNEHKRGLRIGADESEARPFAALEIYGLKVHSLEKTRPYNQKIDCRDRKDPQSNQRGNAG